MLFECFDISQDSALAVDQNQRYYYERAIWRHDLKFSIGLLLSIIPKVRHRQLSTRINVCRMLSAEIPLKSNELCFRLVFLSVQINLFFWVIVFF
jgi:hypothetical protein